MRSPQVGQAGLTRMGSWSSLLLRSSGTSPISVYGFMPAAMGALNRSAVMGTRMVTRTSRTWLVYYWCMTDATQRITVGLIPKTWDSLDWLVAQTGMSKTDVINRAVQLYRFTEQAAAEGSRLALIRPDGTVNQVHIL